MDYRLIITERAEELLDALVYYLIYRLKNEQAALHLLNAVDCCSPNYSLLVFIQFRFLPLITLLMQKVHTP